MKIFLDFLKRWDYPILEIKEPSMLDLLENDKVVARCPFEDAVRMGLGAFWRVQMMLGRQVIVHKDTATGQERGMEREERNGSN